MVYQLCDTWHDIKPVMNVITFTADGVRIFARQLNIKIHAPCDLRFVIIKFIHDGISNIEKGEGRDKRERGLTELLKENTS